MDPEEKSLLIVFGVPEERLVHDQAAGPIVGEPAVRPAGHAVAVGVESVDQAESAVERKRCDEAASDDAGVTQRFGERRDGEVHPQPVVARVMARWIPSGHEARVGDERDRRGRKCLIESHAARARARRALAFAPRDTRTRPHDLRAGCRS